MELAGVKFHSGHNLPSTPVLSDLESAEEELESWAPTRSASQLQPECMLLWSHLNAVTNLQLESHAGLGSRV